MVRSKPQFLKSLRKARGAIHPPTHHEDGVGETRRRAQNNQEIDAQETRQRHRHVRSEHPPTPKAPERGTSPGLPNHLIQSNLI